MVNICVVNTIIFTQQSHHSKYLQLVGHFIAGQVMKDNTIKNKWEYKKGGIAC